MNAPTLAALAPGVFVSGRIVSATSSRNATSSAEKCQAFARAGRGPARRWGSPTRAMPPSRLLTRRIASRRSISRSCFISDGMDDSVELGLEAMALHLVHGKIRGPCRDRRVGERRILAGGGRHARAVGDEYVERVPHLVVRVEDRGLRIPAHAR